MSSAVSANYPNQNQNARQLNNALRVVQKPSEKSVDTVLAEVNSDQTGATAAGVAGLAGVLLKAPAFLNA